MLKNILHLALVSCTLLASVQAMTDMMDRLKDRVIHVESLLQRGRWLTQNDAQDDDGSRYLYVDNLAERDTYYTPRVQFQVSVRVGRASKLNCRLTVFSFSNRSFEPASKAWVSFRFPSGTSYPKKNWVPLSQFCTRFLKINRSFTFLSRKLRCDRGKFQDRFK